MKSSMKFLLALLAAVLVGFNTFAQSVPAPDPEALYENLANPFNSALTWSLGAIGLLMVIGWIRRGIRAKG